MKSTRYYSNQQEKQVAKYLGGKKVANSGATRFNKGDVSLPEFLIECKTTTATERASFSIKEEWLIKNKEEAFAMGKPYSALAFQFRQKGENYYVVDEKLFRKLVQAIRDEENGYQPM